MANHRAPWTNALLSILADGEWHDWEEVVQKSMPLVPPGRAIKKGEASRLTTAKVRGKTPLAVRDHGDARLTGARLIVLGSLRAQIENGRVERDENKRLRLSDAYRDG